MRGMFCMMRWLNLAACLDGTSNTAFLSERAVISGQGEKKVKTALLVCTGGSGWAGNASKINAWRNGDELVGTLGGSEGTFLFDGRFAYGSFTTILPPNAPSCVNAAYEGWGNVSPSSYHAGGVMLALGDGSVRFISETIDTGDLTKANPTGESWFGVWGALGTRAGGESKSL